jgi:hypothetical protein
MIYIIFLMKKGVKINELHFLMRYLRFFQVNGRKFLMNNLL